jgi:hypothetical protein
MVRPELGAQFGELGRQTGLLLAQVLNQAGIDDRRDRIEIAALVEQVLDLIEARFGLGALGAREHKFLAESGQLLLVQ